MNLKIVDVSYHRNGVGGVGFYAVLFNRGYNGRMVASLFDAPGYCAVYNIDGLRAMDIKFSTNGWRGDAFECALRPLVAKWLKEHDGDRIDPFSVPVLPRSEQCK